MEQVNQKKVAEKKTYGAETTNVGPEPMMAGIWKRIEGRINFELNGLNTTPLLTAVKWQRRI